MFGRGFEYSYFTISYYIIEVLTNSFGIKPGTVLKATKSKSGKYYIASWNNEKIYLNQDDVNLLEIIHSNTINYSGSNNYEFKIRRKYIPGEIVKIPYKDPNLNAITMKDFVVLGQNQNYSPGYKGDFVDLMCMDLIESDNIIFSINNKYRDSNIRNKFQKLIDRFPEEVKDLIIPRKVVIDFCLDGHITENLGDIWTLSVNEIFGNKIAGYNINYFNEQYDLFKQDPFILPTRFNYYWTRNHDPNDPEEKYVISTDFKNIYFNKCLDKNAFAFCIRLKMKGN